MELVCNNGEVECWELVCNNGEVECWELVCNNGDLDCVELVCNNGEVECWELVCNNGDVLTDLSMHARTHTFNAGNMIHQTQCNNTQLSYTEHMIQLRALFLCGLHFANAPSRFGGADSPSSGCTLLLKAVTVFVALALLSHLALLSCHNETFNSDVSATSSVHPEDGELIPPKRV